MKKLNNRGFLLVETVIVSIFVLTIFVLVYQNSLPMIEEYKHRMQYDDLDTVYAIGLVRNMVLSDPNYTTFEQTAEVSGYKEIKCSELVNPSACNVLFKKLGIKDNNHVFLTKWSVQPLAKNNKLPSGFLDYVLYLNKQNEEQLTEYRLLMSRTTSYEVKEQDKETLEIKTDEVIRYHYSNIGL